MVQNTKTQNPIMIFIIIALLAYLGAVFQTWDLTNFRNLNTTLIMLYAVSALSALYLLSTPKLPAPNHAILCYVAIGIWGVLMLPFLDYPVGSIIGIPVSNMGILQIITGAIIAYAVYVACLQNQQNQFYMILATVIALTVFVMIGQLYENVFSAWDDVYALIAMPSLIIMTAGIYAQCQKTKIASIVGVIIAIYAIATSDNLAALFLLFMVPFLIGGLLLIDKLFNEKASVIKAILIPTSVIFTTAVLFGLVGFVDGTDDNTSNTLRTLFGRTIIFLNYSVATEMEPSKIFTGFGFASTSHIQTLYGPITNAIYSPDGPLVSARDLRHIQAGGLGADSLHNVLLDTMASVGIVGGLLFLTMFYFIGKSASKYNAVIATWIALAVFYSVWFPTAVTIVPFFVAIGITLALKHNNQNPDEIPQCDVLNKKGVKSAVFITPAVVLLLGGIYHIKQIQLMNDTIINQKISSELFYDSAYNQDHTNYTMSRIFFRNRAGQALNKLIKGETITETELLMFVDTMDVYAKKAEDNHTLMNIELLNVLNVIMLQGAEKDMLKARQK